MYVCLCVYFLLFGLYKVNKVTLELLLASVLQVARACPRMKRAEEGRVEGERLSPEVIV